MPPGNHAAKLIFAGDMQVDAASGTKYNQALSASNMALDEANVDLIVCSGDLTEDGRNNAAEYPNYFGPTWGRTGLKEKFRISIGNHEWASSSAINVTNYFANTAQTGTDPNHYYSYDIGGWHIIHLNRARGQLGVGGAQYNWLSGDLAANGSKPTIVIWHEPYIVMHDQNGSSTVYAYPGVSGMYAVWDLLYHQPNHQVELVLSGHSHVLGRSKRLEPLSEPPSLGSAPTHVQLDPTNGIRQFIGSFSGCGGYVATDPDGLWDTVGNGAGGVYASSNLNCGYWVIDLYDNGYGWTLKLDDAYGNYTTSTLTDTGFQESRVSAGAPIRTIDGTLAVTATRTAGVGRQAAVAASLSITATGTAAANVTGAGAKTIAGTLAVTASFTPAALQIHRAAAAALSITATRTATADSSGAGVTSISGFLDVVATRTAGINVTKFPGIGGTLAITASRLAALDLTGRPTAAATLAISATIHADAHSSGSISSTGGDLTLPLDKFIEAIHDSVTRIVTRVEIHYDQAGSDADTMWKNSTQVALTDGSVSLDRTRSERRTFSGSITGIGTELSFRPGEFWYDKVIMPFRGAYATDGTYWEVALGKFLPDTIDDEEDGLLTINCRDFTKKLANSKFNVPTGFPINSQVETVIQTIATNGGIRDFNLGITDKYLSNDYVFDSNTSRWDAISKLATDYGFDCYFDSSGVLRLEEYSDPYLDSSQYIFQTGTSGNLESIKKSTVDDQLFNSIVVTGATDGTVLPVTAIAQNTEPTSPTRIAAIGERTFFYSSEFITTQAQAQLVANNLLSIHALEQFNADLSAIVVPYLEPGIIVQFTDPRAQPGDPIKYLLSSFSIPIGLDMMPVNIRRVTKVRA